MQLLENKPSKRNISESDKRLISDDNRYRLESTEGEILFDHYMAMNPGFVEEEIAGIPTFEPSFHLPALWITEGQRERAESMGYTVVDPPSIIATHLTEVKYEIYIMERKRLQSLSYKGIC